jgi:hypothetical protein
VGLTAWIVTRCSLLGFDQAAAAHGEQGPQAVAPTRSACSPVKAQHMQHIHTATICTANCSGWGPRCVVMSCGARTGYLTCQAMHPPHMGQFQLLQATIGE